MTAPSERKTMNPERIAEIRELLSVEPQSAGAFDCGENAPLVIPMDHHDVALMRELLDEVERLQAWLEAIEHAGHAETCGGLDEANSRCECGWLQRDGAHHFIESLWARLDAALKVVEATRQHDHRHMKGESVWETCPICDSLAAFDALGRDGEKKS